MKLYTRFFEQEGTSSGPESVENDPNFYVNPTKSQLYSTLSFDPVYKFKTARAIISEEGDLVVFDANTATHDDYKSEFPGIGLYFIVTGKKFICILSHDESPLNDFQLKTLQNKFKTLEIVNIPWKKFNEIVDLLEFATRRGHKRFFEFTIPDWKTQVTDVIKRTYADRRKIKEDTIFDFKGKGNLVTNRTYADRKKIKGGMEKNLILVDFDPGTAIITYLAEPTYKFSNVELDIKGHDKGLTNSYTVEVEFQDYNKWILPEEWKNVSKEDFVDFLKVCDVKWFCSCKGFNYTGIKYQLTQANAAIYKQNIPDTEWKDKTQTPRPSLCKHCLAVATKLIRYPTQSLAEIKRKLK